MGRLALPGVESADLLPSAAQLWAVLLEWPSHHWPWLVLVGSGVAAIALWRLWDSLLEWDYGRFWGVPAALLPALIPIARSYEENSSKTVKSVTVAGLLLAVAVLQLYGQERNKRDRKLADAEINRIAAGVDRIGAGVGRIEAGVSSIAIALSALADEAEEAEQEEI